VKRMRWILASALVAAVPLHAQSASEVVQATPSAEAVASLNRNLASLSRNPQDVTALLGAGQAALDLGDMQAANGFFTRANMVNPQLGKAKLGLAIVQIGLKQPAEAAANFDAAQALGEGALGHLAERGLAYDLTGQQEKAQRDYQQALRANPGNELARLRYAVSLGISGRLADADRQLEAPLAAGDREAWRMRAFILAMNGRIADARKVTQSVMPKGLADALDPYMQRLPLLSTGQKASAAYYGEFPSNVLKLAAPDPARDRDVQVATAATTERESSRRSRAGMDRRASSRATSQPPAAVRQPAAASPPPPPAAAPPPPVQIARNQASPPPVAVQQQQRPAPTPAQPAPTPPPQQRFEAPATTQLASTNMETAPRAAPVQGPADPERAPAAPQSLAQSQAPQPSPVAASPAPGFSTAAQPTGAVSLADALSALEVPEQERQRSAAVADFNAVARIQDQRRKASEAAAAKAKADAEAKAKAEAAKKAEAERKAKLAANPSRNWVQVATGRDVDALAFDLRRLRRTYSDALGDLGGWTAEWGATRRLLVGPFKKPDDAKAVVAKLTKSGGDAFLWQSEAGEEVTRIGGK
jgi:tetratricopeptide (TPR) repeat protein